MAELDLGRVVGPGLPAGGTAGQIPVKQSATNYDLAFTSTPPQMGSLATIEQTSTVSKQNGYKQGEYLVYNGQLYKVTASTISQGETLAVGTNISAVGIADEFAESQRVFPTVTITYGSRSYIRYSKKAGIVSVEIYYFASDGALSTQWSFKDIATLPEGFRPSVDQTALAFSSTSESLGTTLTVYPTGIVRVNCRQATLTNTNDSVGASIVYPTA